MNLRQLEVFYAIMKAGSVTAAARGLNVSQPAISAVLKHTEQQLGMKLFERRAGRLYATPEATSIMADVDEIFGRLHTLNRTVQEIRDGVSGRLVISTSPTLVNSYLPRAIGMFRRSSPSVQVLIQSLPTPLAVDRVARREADLGVVYAPVLDRGVEAEDLAITEIACVMPKGHGLARKRQITSADLAGQSVISLGPATMLGMLIDEQSRKAGMVPPVIGIEASSSITACLLASEGAGVALIDRGAMVTRKFDELACRPFVPRIPVPIKLIYPRERPRSRATIRLSELLKTVSAKTA